MSQTLQSIIHVSNFELSRSTHRHKPSYRGTVGRIKTHLRRKTHNTTFEPFVTLYFIIFSPFCPCYCSISFASVFPTSSWE